ncbi:hypothetical protein DKX38_005106 [Salix brachista]|uniref:Uncharacterized protein n=1 Tax=Salix brachista TaxID=2182728 RepID=A0A5N5NCX8_9ROSI|nr:hypothetical protein DKX38_005106 [Salix brachista]
MARDSCLARVTAGVAVGGAVGGAVGAVYGTYEAIRNRVISPSLRSIFLDFLCYASVFKADILSSWTIESKVYWANHSWKCCNFWSLLGCWELDTLWKVLLTDETREKVEAEGRGYSLPGYLAYKSSRKHATEVLPCITAKSSTSSYIRDPELIDTSNPFLEKATTA